MDASTKITSLVLPHQRQDLPPTKDNKWQFYRVNTTAEDDKAAVLGKYQRRGDATKALGGMAYQPEPRW